MSEDALNMLNYPGPNINISLDKREDDSQTVQESVADFARKSLDEIKKQSLDELKQEIMDELKQTKKEMMNRPVVIKPIIPKRSLLTDRVNIDNVNYAIEENEYLSRINSEKNPDKRFELLKRYFTENITKNVYMKMDLLNSATEDGFKDMYYTVGKFLFMNILLAVETLVSEKGTYKLELKQDNINEVLKVAKLPVFMDTEDKEDY